MIEESELGVIKVSSESIEKTVGIAVLESYGIAGMTSQKRIKDGVYELFGKENASKGIVVSIEEQGVHVELNVVVHYGVKVVEVARSVQEKVAHDLNHMLGLKILSVNVIIHDLLPEKSNPKTK